MSKARPTAEFIVETRLAWQRAATRSAKKKVIEGAAAIFAMSYSNMTRILSLGARKRSLSEKETDRTKEIEQYARKVYDFKMMADYDQKTFTIKRSYESLRDDGQIPAEITLKQIRDAALRIGMGNEYKSPAKKYRTGSDPLDQMQVDYSKSEYFRFRANGQIYIEKPVATKKHEQRLWIGAAVDYVSRVAFFKYYISEGESSGFVRDVLIDVFEEKDRVEPTGEISGARKILQGIPRAVSFDRGSGNVSKETAEGLKKLGVAKITGAAEIDSMGRRTNRSNKKARGMIEKAIGDFKRNFESHLWGKFLLGSLTPDFSLTELNEWAALYCERINSNPHPQLKTEIRWELFAPALAKCAFPPSDARMYFSGGRMVTVVKRMVEPKPGHLFIVPNFCNDGEKVEIVTSGKHCYLFHVGEMIKLRPQVGSLLEEMEKETGSETFIDFEAKTRLAAEIDLLSGGDVNMRLVASQNTWKDDLKEFSEKPRTMEEIRHKARYFIAAILAQRERESGKIIDFQKIL